MSLQFFLTISQDPYDNVKILEVGLRKHLHMSTDLFHGRLCHRNILAVAKLINKVIKVWRLGRETSYRIKNNLLLTENSDHSETVTGPM